jgi:3-deoxy-manno-octulosonate cytidylyltransferase (CMP-KDO synthetase)
MRIDAEIVRSVPLGVDTPADLERARQLLSTRTGS